MKPIGDKILISEINEETKTESGLVVVSSIDENISKGTILEISHHINNDEINISKNDRILFYKNAKEEIGVSGKFIIPLSAVIGVIEEDSNENLDYSETIFQLKDWEEFSGRNYESWKRYSNILEFEIRIDFLQPFKSVEKAGRIIYEELVTGFRENLAGEIHKIKYQVEDKIHATVVSDDKWHVIFAITNSSMTIRKQNTDLKELHSTFPSYINILSKIISTKEFSEILGKKHERVSTVHMSLSQRVQLEGKGTRREYIRNSDVMQHFLKLERGIQDTNIAVLESLGIEASKIGRVDVKIGFDKEIYDHFYRVWLGVEAPANDDHSILDISWELQDHSPGDLHKKEYGKVFSQFFKDIVFQAFYKRWFEDNDDVVCSTVKQK